jgi:hypothetical protein
MDGTQDPEQLLPFSIHFRRQVVFRILIISGLLAVLCLSSVQADEELADINKQATHSQTRTIEIRQRDNDKLTVNAFCLSAKGEIQAAVGSGPGEIRVLDDQGKLLRSWKTSVKPEAINTAADETILVGGEGRLFRFSTGGKVLTEVDAPHTESLRKTTEILREEAIAYLERSKNQNSGSSMKARIGT